MNIKAEQIRDTFFHLLKAAGIRQDVAEYMIEGLIQASLRGVDSHGIRLLPHYLRGFEGGRLNKNPKYKFTQTAASTGKLDGDHAPGHAAGMEGMKKAINLAKKAGVGAVTVNNSTHFGAAAYYAFLAAKEDMIGLSFTHATSHVLSYNGIRPFFGNNPICLAAPCEGEEPFCLDMATTVATFNKVQQYKEAKETLPPGWAVDENGIETNDPLKVGSLLPIGGYKGFGLSMMVEILCALLASAPYGPKVSRMFDTSLSEKRQLGHFFMAIRINAFEDPAIFKRRLKNMMDELRQEPARDSRNPVLVPGDPEKKHYAERSRAGIPAPSTLLKELELVGKNYGIAIKW